MLMTIWARYGLEKQLNNKKRAMNLQKKDINKILLSN
jgi:hypothetical protein